MPTTDVVKPDLQNAKEYNADLGYCGKVKILIEFDVSVFYLHYSDSVGKATISNPVSTHRIHTT
jgi:hypothetical protein